jgi:site-specific DNA-methyltransferase (adenine-specific)
VDLPYGADIETIGNLDKSLTGFADSRKKLLAELPTMLAESYRILSDDRFIVLWFGFNNYCDLCACLSQTGFSYDPVPIIWNKRTHSTQNPDKKYARTYEQALIAWKGSPTFIRIAQTNLIDNVSPVSPLKKLHVAEKPLGVIEKFIFDCTISGQTVLDFCAGSGSTGEAAVRAGRKAILVEENQQACMTIRARMGAL